METIRFKPKIDKLFYLIWIPTTVLLVVLTVLSITSLTAILIMACTDVFTFYFMVSSLIGYVELREDHLFIKYGFFLKKSIKYSSIRDIRSERTALSDTLFSLKSSLDHLRIMYNRFDYTVVSVKDNEKLSEEVKKRI